MGHTLTRNSRPTAPFVEHNSYSLKERKEYIKQKQRVTSTLFAQKQH